jgi:hypothetical protein
MSAQTLALAPAARGAVSGVADARTFTLPDAAQILGAVWRALDLRFPKRRAQSGRKLLRGDRPGSDETRAARRDARDGRGSEWAREREPRRVAERGGGAGGDQGPGSVTARRTPAGCRTGSARRPVTDDRVGLGDELAPEPWAPQSLSCSPEAPWGRPGEA